MEFLSNYLRRYGHETFSSLYVRNYRLYYIGQIISTSGTFMQTVAQAWLVLKLTNSGTALGITSALQYVPILFLGPYGGSYCRPNFQTKNPLLHSIHIRHSGLDLGCVGGNRPGKGVDGLYSGF